MNRGDIVTVSAAGDYGKPRPAVVVQTDALPPSSASVILCPITSTVVDLSFRISVEPDPQTGLRVKSQVMADKILAVPRVKVGKTIGRLGEADLLRLNGALVFLLSLTETTQSEN
ncbi:MAG: type II toxin-antitoxin system PemK/MazF family toxin [Pseudorhizobium sp.]